MAVLPKSVPGTLAGVLCKLPKFHNEHLLLEQKPSDDAAVYKISDDLAMIQTLISLRRWQMIPTISDRLQQRMH